MSKPGLSEEATSCTVRAAGTTVHYHDVGEGAPILLLHSFGPRPGMSAWLTFKRVLPALSARYRCIAMDLPNFGRTGPVVFDEPVHDMMARVALGLMDELGFESFAVVGTSVGGTTAIDLALAVPERLTKLVVGSCHASTGGDPYLLAPSPSEGGKLLAAAAADPNSESLRRCLEALIYDEALVTESLVADLQRAIADGAAHSEALAMSHNRPQSNLASLPSIVAPTLVVHGRDDRMIPLEQALLLLSYLPNAELVVLKRCGHWPPLEMPQRFASHVLHFLDNDSVVER